MIKRVLATSVVIIFYGIYRKSFPTELENMAQDHIVYSRKTSKTIDLANKYVESLGGQGVERSPDDTSESERIVYEQNQERQSNGTIAITIGLSLGVVSTVLLIKQNRNQSSI